MPQRASKKDDILIAKKSVTVAKPKIQIKGGNSLLDRIKVIEQMVEQSLGKYKDEYIVINQEEVLHDYISECIGNGYVALDTETDGLDPLMNTIAGICPYTYGQKGAYIPLNHISYITGQKSKGQLPIDFVITEFNRLLAKKPDIDMFNAPFDIRVLRHMGLPDIYCTWDGYTGARVLNENEPTNQLKPLHNKYCLGGKGDAFRFDDLFKGIPFTMIPYMIGYLYAAHDGVITSEYNDFQRKYLYYEPDKPFTDRNGMNGVAYAFHNIEMPILEVVANLEDTGITLDMEYAKQLSMIYHEKLDAKKRECEELCNEYSNLIEQYRNSWVYKKNPDAQEKQYNANTQKVKGSTKLDNPINIGSPTQLAILFYDILKIESPDPKNPRGTGEEILQKIDLPLARAILDYRGLDKLIGTYIDKMPNCVNPNDGRVHCKFNSYGADCITGDSLLLTNHGYVPISNLFNDEDKDGEFIQENMTIVNKDLQFEQTSHRVVYHDTGTIKVQLRGGYSVEGTPNHPIIISDLTLNDKVRSKNIKQLHNLKDTEHFEKLENLKVGDMVAIPYGYNIFPSEYQKLDCELYHTKTHNSHTCTLPSYCDEDFAELLGIYHADGTYKYSDERFTIHINNGDKEVLNRVAYLVKKLFNLDVTYYPSSRCNSGCITFGNLQIRGIEKYLTKHARNKRIPNIIMQSPKSVVCAYIRGMTLDSSFDAKRQRLFMSCADNVSFNFLQDSLTNMGILTQVRYGEYTAEHDHAGNEVSKMNVRRLGIMGEMYKKFLDLIGVIQSSKELRLDHYKKPHYITYDNVYYAYVTEVEKSVNTVYDLHVPNTHSFIANSMINHNTGRFSSSEPNMQNIPSRNHDIRKMFVASDGYVLLSSDYSQQEPSCLATFCKQAGSTALFDARFKGNDLYSEVASACFNLPYEMCCEFDKNGHKNPPEYKARRNQAKPVLLGILYGRGDDSVAEQLNCSLDEAKALKSNLFRKFPEIKKFEDDSLAMAYDLGYVTTVCGRKRRLPDYQLDRYTFRWKNGVSPYDDPLDFSEIQEVMDVPYDKQSYYLKKLNGRINYQTRQRIVEEANKEGIWIDDNFKKISDAQRQIVNSRIQGSAADLTKLAMIKLDRSEELKALGFRMLVPIHDEILGECPEENAKKCAELLAKTMSKAAEEILYMPFSCDVEVSKAWYGESIEL